MVHFAGYPQKVALIFWILNGLCGITTRAAQLKPETAAAFDRYVAATEARMNEDLQLNQFLVIDRLPAVNLAPTSDSRMAPERSASDRDGAISSS